MFIDNVDSRDRIGPVREVDHHPGLVDNEGQSDMTRRISRQQKRQEQQDSWEKKKKQEDNASPEPESKQPPEAPEAETPPPPLPGHLDYKA
jgi:hypothetical protein